MYPATIQNPSAESNDGPGDRRMLKSASQLRGNRFGPVSQFRLIRRFRDLSRALGHLPDSGRHLRICQVPQGMNDQQIIDLARQLHADQPKDTIWLLDDKSQIRQLLASLPKTAQGDFSTYPREWFDKHCVASIQLAVGGGKSYWVVVKGSSTDVSNPLAKLS